MLTPILLIAFSWLAPLTSASAAGQFSLNVQNDASQCWLACHIQTIRQLWDVDNPLNVNYQAIGDNCKAPEYTKAMPDCLIDICKSAPDVAYAIEFGTRWCKKAGIDTTETLKLPESYTQGLAKEYFQSAAYLNSASSMIPRPKIVALGGVALLAPLINLVL